MLVTFSGSVPVFKCYRGHTTVMSGVCVQRCHEDSPVDPVDPFPVPSPFSDNDWIVFNFRMLCGSNALCTDAVKILCICLDKRESKIFCKLHESIISLGIFP